MKLGPFQEVILESSSVEELKEKVCLCYLHSLPHHLCKGYIYLMQEI